MSSAAHHHPLYDKAPLFQETSAPAAAIAAAAAASAVASPKLSCRTVQLVAAQGPMTHTLQAPYHPPRHLRLLLLLLAGDHKSDLHPNLIGHHRLERESWLCGKGSSAAAERQQKRKVVQLQHFECDAYNFGAPLKFCFNT